MDFRSLPCVLLGYNTSHKGYLCFHIPTWRIYIYRHVIFNETVFPYATQPPPVHSTTPPIHLATTLHLLEQVTVVPTITTPPTPPLSPSPSTVPNTQTPITPSYQQPTTNSRAKHTQPSQSHFRPAENTTNPMVTWARTNSLKPKTFSATIISSPTVEPRTYQQAMQHSYWQHAMSNEFCALLNNKTWSLVPRPPHVNLVGCKWIFRIKQRSDGFIERHKARLVAQGYSQEHGIDYFDTFSPVIKPTTI